MNQRPVLKNKKVKFALVGILNTGLDFTLLLGLNYLGINKYIANTLSTGSSFILSFILNRRYTFKSSINLKKQVLLFFIVTVIGLWVLQPTIIFIVSSYVDIGSDIANLIVSKVIATIASLVWNYILYSKIVFKD